MRTFGILLLIGVLGMPLVATAEEAAQQTSQDRVRSAGRTWGGVALLAVVGRWLPTTARPRAPKIDSLVNSLMCVRVVRRLL